MDTKKSKFFPPFLNQGSRDAGNDGPVRHLQNLLAGMHDINTDGLEVNGIYDARTADCVTQLQKKLGDLEPDGNFGPATRVCLFEQRGISIDSIMTGETFMEQAVNYRDDSGNRQLWWPPAAAH
jgi:peptidoglycan hydrolase-like protein with peptidoglycan-binding domain